MIDINQMTKQEKKEYFIPYIVVILNEGVKPSYHSYDTGQSIEHYYYLGSLPFGRSLIYEGGKLFIVVLENYLQEPRHEGVYYSSSSIKRLFKGNVDLVEKDLITRARNLIKYFKGTYQVPIFPQKRG